MGQRFVGRTAGSIATIGLVVGLLTAAPAQAATSITIGDADFAKCIASTLHKPSTTRTFTTTALASITGLFCGTEADDGTKPDIRSISGAEHLTQLTTLNLDFSRVSDFGPLSSLQNLQIVAINSAHLTSLDSLVNAISQSPALTTLTVVNNPITTLAPLTRLHYLDRVTVSSDTITDLNGIADWGSEAPRRLGVSGSRLTDISAVSGLTRVIELGLNGLSITDLSAIADMTGLTDLAVTRTSVSNVDALASLASLRTLELSDNKITRVAALTKLTNLQLLNLRGNPLKTTVDLADFAGHSLKSLWLDNTGIGDLRGLTGITSLTSLLLSNNTISDLSPLSRLTNLTQLHLGSTCDDKEECTGNRVSDISALATLTKLKDLDLSNNSISSIKPLLGLRALESVTLTDNKISDVSPLRYVGSWSQTLQATQQHPSFTVAVGASVPLRAWKGALPKITSSTSGLLVINGKLVAAKAGDQTAKFRSVYYWFGQIWQGTAQVRVSSPATVKTALAVNLNSSAKNHTRNGTATVRFVSKKKRPTGTIIVVDGTKRIKTATISPKNKGVIRIKLRKLKRGTHHLVFFYTGTTTMKSSVKKVTIRVR